MLSKKIMNEIDARIEGIVNSNLTFKAYFLSDDYLEEKLDIEYRLWVAVLKIQDRLDSNFGRIVATNNTIARLQAAKHEGKIKPTEVDELKVNELIEVLEAKKQGYEWDREDLYDEAQKAIRDYEQFYEQTDPIE